MNVAKQIIDNQVRNLVKEYPEFFADIKDENKKLSTAFLLLGVASYLNLDIQTAYQLLTEGSDDGGFDAAYIDDKGGELNVVLFQAKYVFDLAKESAFPENAIEKAVNVIRCIFDPSISLNLNEKSGAVVDEIRSLIYAGEIPHVVFVCLNNGIKWNNKGQDIIDREFEGQKQVDFDYYNCNEMVDDAASSKKVDVNLQLTGPALHEDFNYKSVIIGRVSVSEIAGLMKQYGDKLLQKNIRYYLGSSKVNNQIKETLMNADDNPNFFFYNNGITIICDMFTANYLQKENWIVKLSNMQIINGGQTCRTIENAVNDKEICDISSAYVLVRIYQLDAADTETIRKITVATNSQNAVDLRDLRANDERQRLLEKGAQELGYTYKTKRDNSRSDQKTIPSSVCAEAVFSVWRKKPFLAKYHKSELFDKYFDEIYGKDQGNLNAAQMIIAVLVFRYCDGARKKKVDIPEQSLVRRYGNYLAASLMGAELLKKKNLTLEELTHRTFDDVYGYFENNKDSIYTKVENIIISALKDRLSYLNVDINQIDGRTIAAAFRNEEFCGECMKMV